MTRNLRFYCVTPCLNPGPLLAETMLSILGQTHLNAGHCSLHYVVQDGGSTDSSGSAAAALAQQHGERENVRIIVRSDPDRGMYDALRKGFSDGPRADVYFYLNAGDLLSPHAFSVVASLFAEHPVHFLTGTNTWYTTSGVLCRFFQPRYYHPALLLRGFYGTFFLPVQQESTFWSGAAHQLIDWAKVASCRLAGDIYIWQSIIQRFPLNIVSAWLSGFRWHPGQQSQRFKTDYFTELRANSFPRRLRDYLHALAFFLFPKWAARRGKKFFFSYCTEKQCFVREE